MSRRLLFTLAVLLCGRARADVAFALQPGLGVGTAVQPIDTTTASSASSSVPRESFLMVPTLRLGIDLGSVMILAYGTNANTGVEGHQVVGITRAGALVEPTLWRSHDGRVAMYLVAGGGLVTLSGATVTINAMMTKASSFVSPGVTFVAGVGGSYAVHPNFAIGLELAVQPDFVSLDSGLYIGNQAIVSVTGTFLTGDRTTP